MVVSLMRIEAGGHGEADFDADDGAGDFQGEENHAAGKTEHQADADFHGHLAGQSPEILGQRRGRAGWR